MRGKVPAFVLSGTFVLGTALTAVEGLVYVAVAALLVHHGSTPRLAAWRFFVAWWAMIGGNKLLAAAAGLGAAQGWLSTDAYVAVIFVNLAVLCASLFCLMSYLLYLFTGSTTPALWTGLGYLAYFGLLVYVVAAGRPTDVGVGAWRTFLVNAGPGAPPLVLLVNLLLLFVPQVVGAALYASLYRQLSTPTARYRVTLVPLAIVAWSLSILFIALPAFANSAPMQVGSRLLGALAAAIALLAYRPPLFIRERLDRAEAA